MVEHDGVDGAEDRRAERAADHPEEGGGTGSHAQVLVGGGVLDRHHQHPLQIRPIPSPNTNMKKASTQAFVEASMVDIKKAPSVIRAVPMIGKIL